MTAKHTPGPWRYIDPRESPVGKRRPPEVVDADNNRIAQIDTRRERHDNGTLIAASPALADALQAIVEAYEGNVEQSSLLAGAAAALRAAGRLP